MEWSPQILILICIICIICSQDRAEQATPRLLAGPSSSSRSIVSALRAVPPAVREAVVDDVAMFLLTSETPFLRINNKYIKHAFKTVRVGVVGEGRGRGGDAGT